MDQNMCEHINLKNIREASERIKNFIHMTPVITCQSISSMVRPDCRLFFKCEAFQKTGSFKIRGALNAVLCLDVGASSVVTHSSGNHAQALAYAARIRGIPAYIVMPEGAPSCKVAAVEEYGGLITFAENRPQAREREAQKIADEAGAAFIHPSNDPAVICGQGTIGLELLAQVSELCGEELDAVIVPIGGGGLCSGIAVAVKSLRPNIKVIAAEPANADDAFQSKQKGNLMTNEAIPETIADGLKTNLGSFTWPVVRDLIDEVITVSEEQIKEAMKVVYERMKIVIEPSAAVGVAVAISKTIQEREDLKNIAVVLCGGNVNLQGFSSIFI